MSTKDKEKKSKSKDEKKDDEKKEKKKDKEKDTTKDTIKEKSSRKMSKSSSKHLHPDDDTVSTASKMRKATPNPCITNGTFLEEMSVVDVKTHEK